MITKLMARLRTPVFANTGSTARDHLASERTFLAWIRTGLGFIALGIAVERFSQLDLEALTNSIERAAHRDASALESSKRDAEKATKHEAALVPVLLGTGTGSIVYGSARYFTNLRLIERGLFTPAYHGVAFLSVSCATIAGAAYWGMINRERNKHEQSNSAEGAKPQYRETSSS